jgi:hypothetical protein
MVILEIAIPFYTIVKVRTGQKLDGPKVSYADHLIIFQEGNYKNN